MVLKDSEMERMRGKIETLASYNATLEKEIQDTRGRLTSLNDEIHLG